ncbi:hypothetical protein ET445_01325 [Agromyces protaetiae]|uniref:QsdR TetR regulatory C-terminal domain-containing protein n=1 Tax=Agromyces protaetiae TaxID=2509455 RepID=A0A4P6F7W4_9MICO|nr:QsdR family transcriptional regulator [Agromyces protaetiae]QAY72180.1 hypothetical protein ET445_01325 [Agromyces protaetiae]
MPSAPPAALTAPSAAPLTIANVGLEVAPSWLSQRLVPGVHDDAVRAFGFARETFISGKRIDMGALAARLGVDRTSLFRWVGNRDALLSEVLWSLAVPTLVQAEQAVADYEGAERVAELLTHFVDDLSGSDYFREFSRREPSRALRLQTTRDSEIQRRYVATIEFLVRRDMGDEPLDGAIGAHDLATLLARVSESFTYADQIAGEPPSVERARTAFRVLLRAD